MNGPEIVLNLRRSHCIIVFSLFSFFYGNVSSIYASSSTLEVEESSILEADEENRGNLDRGNVDLDEYAIEVTDERFELPDTRTDNIDETDPGISIYAKVFDKYGKVVNGTVSYSWNLSDSWNYKPMKLINGVPSNGTFRGIISDVKDNSTIYFAIHFEDELGYRYSSWSKDSKDPELINLNSTLSLIPKVDGYVIGHALHMEPIVIRAYLNPKSAVTEMDLEYWVLWYPNQTMPTRTVHFFVPMNFTSVDKFDNGSIYTGYIPPFEEKTSIQFRIHPYGNGKFGDEVGENFEVGSETFSVQIRSDCY